MFLVNSRYRHFSAALSGSVSKLLHLPGHTFSLSYGVILPSSLTRVLSSALGFSPYLPVSVFGTITWVSRLEDFLGSMGSVSLFRFRGSSSHLGIYIKSRIFLRLLPTCLNHLFHQMDDLPSCFPPSLKRYFGGTGILTCFPSPTPCGLGLGID
jgi:hypothetical protein